MLKDDKYMVVFSCKLMLDKTSSEIAFRNELKERLIEKGKKPEDDENANWEPTGDITTVEYPSIFFYNLTDQKVEWEILGAEVFICLDDDGKVFYLTNEAWAELDADDLYYFRE